MIRFLTSALLGALVLACAQPAPEAPAAPAVDTTAAVAAIGDLWTRWSAADTAGDVAALAGMVTENFIMDAMGIPATVGREAARAVWEPMATEIDYSASAITPDKTVVVSNELAHQAGTFTSTFTAKGKKGTMTEYGRYIAAVVKEADGQWRAAYVMAMTDSTITKK